MRILVVEDDPDLNRQIVAALGDAGYVVDKAMDGEEGCFLGETEPYDAVVLDLGLPVLDGVSVLEKWRRAGKKMPVLILTARDRWSDKVAGFDAGADDMWPSLSTWKKCWPACAHFCAAVPDMPQVNSPADPWCLIQKVHV